MKKIGLTLLTAFLGGAMAIGGYKVIESKSDNDMSFEDRQKVYFANNPMPPVVSSTGNVDFTEAAAAVTPAVVYIRTTYTNTSGDDNQMEEFFGQVFGQHQRSIAPQRASGSGVIISTDGYIVTNNHVVDKADKIEVITNDKRTFQAKVIGTDPNTDLALIKISATNLPIVKFGNSDDARVGEWVLAVGNPFNLTSTVTAGIISAKGRSIGIIGSEDNGQDQNPFGGMRYQQQSAPRLNKGIESFIQTDAAINPGNSGGALVNTKGELIGINAAIASQTGSYEGYGFAIPVNLAKKVLNDIEKYGKVKRGYVGVSFQELNPDAADALHIKNTVGLYINDLVAGGGAAQAGLHKGDIITKVNGRTVTESSDLEETVARLHPGDKVNLTVNRDGQDKNFTVTLKSDVGSTNSVAVTHSAEELYNKLGASFKPLSDAKKNQFHVNSGVVVTQVRRGKMFDQLGMAPGSVITSINHMPINSSDDIDKAVTNIKNGFITISGINPDGSMFTNRFQLQ